MINRCRNWGHVGITSDGTNADYAVLPTQVLQVVEDGVNPLDVAFLNSAALAVRSVDRAGLVAGDRVVVVGPGPVGLLMLQRPAPWAPPGRASSGSRRTRAG